MTRQEMCIVEMSIVCGGLVVVNAANRDAKQNMLYPYTL